MANVRNANTFYVDTSSSGGTATSYIDEQNIRILGVIFTTAANTDVINIFDKSSSGASAGSKKLSLASSVTGLSNQIRLADVPLVCPNGIWVSLTGSPTCTLIVKGNN